MLQGVLANLAKYVDRTGRKSPSGQSPPALARALDLYLRIGQMRHDEIGNVMEPLQAQAVLPEA